MAGNIRAHVLIEGRVQGVFFRDATRRRAWSLGVKGWVRNLFDGRVEAVFEGPQDAVAKMVQFVHQGPPGARVTKVDVAYEEYSGEFNSFRVRPTS